MHPTLSQVNVKTSLKLFFNEKFGVEKEIPIIYDKSVTDPFVTSTEMGGVVDKWLTILFRNTDKFDVSEMTVEIFCCARKESDDLVMDRLMDDVNSILFPENGHLSIPFYDVQTETIIGNLFFLKRLYGQTGSFNAVDGTKYAIFSVPIKWIAVI